MPPTAALRYLDDLDRWCRGRKLELDDLDAAALRSGSTLSAGDQQAVTSDLLLSMALWKAVSDRFTLMRATWDSGRVDETARRQLATLIWGRLEEGAVPATNAPGSVGSGALAVSVPEACRLSDALAGQLRIRLALEQSGIEVAERVRQLRAQLERIRDQIRLDPDPARRDAAGGRLNGLATRVSAVLAKLGRGGDVGGLVGPLEIDAATTERDLIVAAANRTAARGLVEHTRSLLADVEVREAALRTLVSRTVATVDPAPRYGVPDADALGPMPNTRPALEAYLTRLENVSRALVVAQDAYTAALAERDELSGRLEALAAKAAALRLTDTDLIAVHDLARAELDRRPCRIILARPLVVLYLTYLQILHDDRPRKGTAR
ncbi:MAG: hypothetical protein ACR2LI_01390 [Propionibacteriaceae bacterium]